MDNLKIEEIKLTAFVIHDKSNGLYTVALESKGGPIISAPTSEEACSEFKKALDLSCAAQNLLAFKEAVRSSKIEMVKKKEPKIEFITVEEEAA